MKRTSEMKQKIHIAIFGSDPVRYLGFQACLSSESDFDIQAVSLRELSSLQAVDLVLVASHIGDLEDLLRRLRVVRPDVPCIFVGCDLSDEIILQAISAGVKGCVDERAPINDLARAIRAVFSGSLWVPRRVLSTFIERAQGPSGQGAPTVPKTVTPREKQVLEMLVAGCSNKEIAAPLGIEERTVKAHVAKLMRKMGATNRIVLSVHAITHALVRV